MKTDRDNGSFSIISLTECQEALSERHLGKQTRDTYLSGADIRAQSIGIDSYTYWGQFVFRDISLDNET